MTLSFSTAQLANMQAAQSNHFMDTCIIQTCSETQNTSHEPIATYTDGSAIACGFNPKGGREMEQPDKTVLRSDASVRLPIGTTITPKDRFKITKRHGVAVTNDVYQVVGNPMRGPSGILLDLQRVQV